MCSSPGLHATATLKHKRLCQIRHATQSYHREPTEVEGGKLLDRIKKSSKKNSPSLHLLTMFKLMPMPRTVISVVSWNSPKPQSGSEDRHCIPSTHKHTHTQERKGKKKGKSWSIEINEER